ncbi:NAD(P)-dependent dehydrogenase (short-subunit alcohol dehydrogenase family) [Nocardioides cavernae]|uniref:NAD(P)-dependent dehydrogenase (Short-subunit alcohol dehydrogenase family) n=1 Tax=Nocardioides cavernae TaxID=1921566 RepID=A0A7Y9H124_9ACTN|nr:SDR family oxidoreductase [Nocardioides cavernae]NYE35850.1 NAD(P)-dependent dehydrogenase (short-subunit alcohol dehydrogenase family) [Nocardioides cavernae]
MSLFDLTGKVGLVTGGNQGLGLGFASGMAKCGADVVLWGRRAARNEAAADELRAHGVRVLAQEVDVTDEHAVADAMREVVAEMGRVDCVVANAGASSRPESFHEMTSEMYHDLLAVSQHGAFHTLREAVRHMKQRADDGDPGGSLIACGSLMAIRGTRRLEHYAAAKGALLSMVRGIAVEYGRDGIRANVVAPGFFETDLTRSTYGDAPADGARRWSRYPVPRAGNPADLEGITAYLMSDASVYHTGDLIVIDGGLSVGL